MVRGSGRDGLPHGRGWSEQPQGDGLRQRRVAVGDARGSGS